MISSIRCNGFEAGGICAGIKKNQDFDLGLIYTPAPAVAAAVFTRNRIQAAPVRLSRSRIGKGMVHAVVVNSGNANCCTGVQGDNDAGKMTRITADSLGLSPETIAVASTGVIGVPLPMEKIEKAIPELVKTLDPGGFGAFSRSIMTTDTVPKLIQREGNIEGHAFSVLASAKGAGMIRPDMATMLCFVCTDVEIAYPMLQQMLKRSVDQSLNCITIDGDTSTNDMVLVMANGRSGVKIETDEQQKIFQRVLDELLMDVAQRLVQDGEGVTKVVDILIEGAASDQEAFCVADTVAHSPLVKTAFFGEDANWGRILAAVGRAGVGLDPNLIDVYFDKIQMVKNGQGCGPKAEAQATKVLQQANFSIVIALHQGHHRARMLTSDFSTEYIKINADYRS